MSFLERTEERRLSSSLELSTRSSSLSGCSQILLSKPESRILFEVDESVTSS